MLSSKPVQTLLVIGSILSLHDGSSLVDSTKFRQVVGNLQYLLTTYPDIVFVVNKLSQFMHALFKHHWGAIKCLLCNLNGTRELGIQLHANSSLSLHYFSNADQAGNVDDHTSTRTYILFLGPNQISQSSKKQ